MLQETITQYLLKNFFQHTQAVSVWGGEDGSFDSSLGVTSTPSYGKVFISIKSNTGQNLTSEQKHLWLNLLGHLRSLQLHQLLLIQKQLS